jgi:lipopolysaccharide biosynthesis protein
MKFRDPKNVDVIFAIHIYYYDMLDDLCSHIDKLRNHLDFEVIVSTTEANRPHIETIAQRLDAFKVIPMENRGRDVLPFLRLLKEIEGFKYCCKIHTKNIDSKNTPYLCRHEYNSWRDLMWNELMDPEKAKKAFKELKDFENPIYAPTRLWYRRISRGVFKKNLEDMKRLSKALGMKLHKQPFIAGTMFWFKVDRLTWLNKYDLEPLFDPEEGALDGKMEHALERCFVQLARRPKQKR